MGLQADYRAAAVSLMTDCAQNASVNLQVYKARPSSLYPPTGFVDRMGDEIAAWIGPTVGQHTPVVEIMLVWGLFDSAEAADQRDAFVDAFHEHTRTRFHEAGAATLIGPRTLADEPNFIPDWLPEEQQKVYYATRIVLEGFATD
jgi:hypothetical protein